MNGNAPLSVAFLLKRAKIEGLICFPIQFIVSIVCEDLTLQEVLLSQIHLGPSKLSDSKFDP
jgi:hypothetical protein